MRGRRRSNTSTDQDHGAVQQRRGTAELDQALLHASSASTLDLPRRLVDLSTGLPSLTSLFNDLSPVVECPGGTTVFYIHVPSSAILEERFGWEALEAYRGLIANYLVGLAQELRREREHCVVVRAFADDFAMVSAHKDSDDQIPGRINDGLRRHLAAIDQETAALLQVYVGMAHTKPFPKIHHERRLYRTIQAAQTEATDVGRQKLSTQLRVLDQCINAPTTFKMLYQPIVRVADHRIFAYEALVRCQQRELRSPHVLFDVAERGDRIWSLSRLLRAIACAEVPNLPGETALFLNLHPRDFEDPTLLELEGDLARHATRVVLEVTERAAILDMDLFRSKLAALRELGLKIAIDDLGSGYSALSLVAELDPDFVKLDMTLVRDINESPVRQNLVRNMVSFAADLGAEVVAEGVETPQELQTVRDLGCQLVQGFYLAVPSAPFVRTITPTPAADHDGV